MGAPVEYDMRADSIFPREEIARAEATMKDPNEEPSEIGMAEESEEAIKHRHQRNEDQINLIMMVLHYRNYKSDEEKLRQIRVIVE